jgi:predicted transcriptional regulator
MSTATLVHHINTARLQELMVERGLDVHALATAAGVSDRTLYTVLHGRPVSLHTAIRIYQALDGDRTGFFPTP